MYRRLFSSCGVTGRWGQLVGLGLLCAILVLSASGCKGGKKSSKSPHQHDTLVPKSTQRESERNMAEQQMMMQDLSMTTSEQAGAQHQHRLDERHDRANDKKD